MSAAQETLSQVANGIGYFTLNRPAALNALTFDMLKALRARLDEWARDPNVHAVVLRGAGEKAFCAGGDVRAIRASFLQGSKEFETFFAFEYALDHFIHRYPKPFIALMHGIVMGGGMGLAQGAALRIATESTRMAMPETTIGFFPDVGGSYFLSRLPGGLGAYLGLTGHQIRAADVMYCGLADVYFTAEDFARIETTLNTLNATHGDALLAALRERASLSSTSVPTPAPLAQLRPAIDQHFSHVNVPTILASLRQETREDFRDWAQATLEVLAKRSPLMLCVTLEQLRRGKNLSLEDCFRMELNMLYRSFERGDFLEGVRALLVDKDHAPRWLHPRVEDVRADEIAGFFEPRWEAYSHPLRVFHSQ
jgi:enoyl-CoA hydratase/carnithine racemase